LAIDSTLAEAHTALGLVAMHDWDYPAAEKQYLTAIALEPHYATAHQWYGEYLLRTGRVDTATAEIRRAIALDPLAPILESVLAFALSVARRYDEGIAAAKRGIELAPTAGIIHSLLADNYLMKGEHAKGVREMEISARLDASMASRQGALAYAYGFSGDTTRARAVLARLMERAKSERISSIAFAMAYVGLGENDAALSALERAVDQHDIALTNLSLLTQHHWDPLRGEPRFTRILERLNLGPYIGGRNRR
jgi:serine/threonine-protein kinase